MHALTPAEQLLADLPHTTLDRSQGADDYELRRRSLSIEVTDQPDSGDTVYTEPLRVHSRDGCHTLVAGDRYTIAPLQDERPQRPRDSLGCGLNTHAAYCARSSGRQGSGLLRRIASSPVA